jgi:hypothetical protein
MAGLMKNFKISGTENLNFFLEFLGFLASQSPQLEISFEQANREEKSSQNPENPIKPLNPPTHRLITEKLIRKHTRKTWKISST